MNILYRLYQKILYLASFFLNWKMPIVLSTEKGLTGLALAIKQSGVSKILIVSGGSPRRQNMLSNFLDECKSAEIDYVWYDGVVPNPTVENVYAAESLYRENNCNGIVAVGGGSAMDTAKLVGARIATNKTIEKMRGLFKIRKTIPPLFAVPTTSGSGSETTIAAVIRNEKTLEKFAVTDLHLMPSMAVLDPSLTISVPPKLTATTGMDALTHALEAYLGKSNTRATKKQATSACKLIFANLLPAYNEPTDLVARGAMMDAAYLAGQAFTRAFVGNVHALAHAIGGKYNVEHGLANAIILPYMLDFYGKSIYKKLAQLALLTFDKNELTNVCEKTDNKLYAQYFVEKIKQLNAQMDIPSKIAEIKENDIEQLASHAFYEANPTYPVPKIMNKCDFADMLKSIMS